PIGSRTISCKLICAIWVSELDVDCSTPGEECSQGFLEHDAHAGHERWRTCSISCRVSYLFGARRSITTAFGRSISRELIAVALRFFGPEPDRFRTRPEPTDNTAGLRRAGSTCMSYEEIIIAF